jgi:hypothetical protein
MENLKAAVHYGDWEGTAAADHIDTGDVRDLLEAKGVLADDEFIIAVAFYVGENRPGRVQAPAVHVLIAQGGDYDTVAAWVKAMPDPLPLRRVDLELSTEEFLGLFKRFNVVLTRRGLDLTGRTFTTDD